MPLPPRAAPLARTLLQRRGQIVPALCLLLAMAGSPGAVLAQAAAQGLSWARAQTLAVQAAPALAARRESWQAAQQLRTAAGQLPDPRLVVALENLPISGPMRFTISGEPMTQRSLGWMQEVPNAAKRGARTLAAQARAEREQAMLQVEQLAVLRDVTLAWLARWTAERRLAAFAAVETQNRLLRDTLAARVAGGGAMPADALMAQQDALMLADRRDELQREADQAQAALVRWLGDEARQPLLGDPPELVVDPAALHAGIERHADVLAFDPMLRMTAADQAEAEAGKRGDWSWQLMYSRRNPAYGDMVGVQFTVELPLWAAERQDPQIAARHHDAERLSAEREDMRRRRREEIDMQLSELDETQRMAERLAQSALPLSVQRVDLALAAYGAGRGSLAEVLATRREHAEIELRAVQLRGRALALRARLNYLIAETP